MVICLFLARKPQWASASSFARFLDYTQLRSIVGRTSLDEWSARRRDLYLTTHNTHNRQTSMPPVRFEPTISAGELPQTCALDRAATGTGKHGKYLNEMEYSQKHNLFRKDVIYSKNGTTCFGLCWPPSGFHNTLRRVYKTE